MLRFQSPNRNAGRNYQSRREQGRLLLLVISLGVVFMSIRALGRPGAVAAISQLFAAPVEQDPNLPGDSRADELLSKSAPVVSATEVTTPPQDDLHVAIESIQDQAPFRMAEQPAWFALFKQLQSTSPQDLAARSLGAVSCAQLLAQPQVYRAKLVTVRGTVRRVTREQPAENDLGFSTIYRLIIQPRGESLPVFAYCLALPADIPLGSDVAAEASITGFFFKNLSYESEGGPAIAPVLVAKSPQTAAPPAARSDPRPLAGQSQSAVSLNPPFSPASSAQIPVPRFDEVMALAGWNQEKWLEFTDAHPPTDAENRRIGELLWRLRRLEPALWQAWSQGASPLASLGEPWDENPGELVRLSGQVNRFSRQPLPPDDALRLEMTEYYRCEITLDAEGGVAVVMTTSVPSAWRPEVRLEEKVALTGVFLKRLPAGDGPPQALFAARRLEWFPSVVREPEVSFGKVVLANLGVDISLLDDIKNHQPIRAEESDAFFAILAAVNEVGVSQIIRYGLGNLGNVAESWSSELDSSNPSRRVLAREVVERAKQGQFSVAPLFNDADAQIGRLVVLDGVARRVLRVEVSAARNERDVPATTHGVDHYYELDLFTLDSQNRPIVCCVRELPPGFPTGEDLNEPVRVGGFFFKSWHYAPRSAWETAGDAPAEANRGLIAPLIISRGPIRLPPPEGRRGMGALLGGGLFVLAFSAVCGLVWWYSRDERKFKRTAIHSAFSLPEGQSLDDLHLPATDPSAIRRPGDSGDPTS